MFAVFAWPYDCHLSYGQALELDVLEDDRRHVMAARADRHDAARRAGAQRRHEEARREEVAEVVRAELELEAVGRLHRRARHDAGVVDHDVQRRMAREEAAGEGADLLKRAELQLRHLDVRVAGRLADARGDSFTLRQVAGGEDHVRAPLGERPRRFLADPARPAGD